MIGKNTLEIIGPDQLTRGVSTGAEIADGGFSSETDAVNLLAVPGVLYAAASVVDSDTDTRLTGNIIATCPDMAATSPTNRLAISDDGKGYRYNGTKITAVGIALTAGKTWTAGMADIVVGFSEAYATSKEAITRWQNDDTIDAGADFPFTFSNQTVWHPAIVYENNIYYGDGNLLLVQTAAGVAPTTALTLATGQIIIALGIDPGSGYMLISTTNVLDISATLTSINKLLWYDGNSLKVLKSALIEEPILGFHCVGGMVYVGYNNNVGYLSGSGVQWLRRLVNVTADNTQLPYKHHMAHVGNTFYVLDGLKIMAHGEVLAGRKVWYPALTNNTNANKPVCLADVGAKKLAIAFATSKFYTFDTSSVATSNSITFYTNKITFPRPVYIRGFYFEYADAVANNDDNRFFYYRNEAETLVLMRNAATDSIIKNTSGGSVYYFECPTNGILDDKVRMFQGRYIASGTNSGLRRVVMAYDVAE